MRKPAKLSIITINFNNRKGLKRTIESVSRQSYRDFEYIVIDGLSTDGSPEVIAGFGKDQIHHWVSEQDKNEYDAMNKGIRMAQGEYVLFLNSGDTLYEADALKNVFAHQFSEDLIYADVCIDNLYRKFIRRYPERLTTWFLYSNMICHQVQIIRRSVFEKTGFYDHAIPIVADYDLMLNALVRHRFNYRHIPIILSIYQLGGKSGKPEYTNIIAAERKIIHEKYFKSDTLQLLQDFDQEIYHDYHEIISSRSFRIYRMLTRSAFLNRVANHLIDLILNLLKGLRRMSRPY